MSFAVRHSRTSDKPCSSTKRPMNGRKNNLLAIFLIISLSASLLSGFMISCGDEAPQSDSRQASIEAILLGTTLVASPSTAAVGDEITFYANASSDIPSATLTFTISYDYLLSDGSTVNPASPTSVNTTGTPGSVITKYTYDEIGPINTGSGTYYAVKLVVSDGSGAASKLMPVYIVENTAPVLLLKPSSKIPFVSNVALNISFKIMDVDNDPVTVTWDFGDESTDAVNTTGPASVAVYVNQTHTWSIIPDPAMTSYSFYLKVTFEDIDGNKAYSNHTVTADFAFNDGPDIGLRASTAYADLGQTVTIFANGTDPEGDAMTWTFIYNNSVEDYYIEVLHADATAPNTTVWMNVTQSFADYGNYSVVVYLTDSSIPSLQTGYHNVSDSVAISVVLNRAPYVLANISRTPAAPVLNFTLGYVSVNLSIQANDLDGDILTAYWDFGDGTEEATNISLGGIRVYTFTQQHNYTSSGIFNVSVLIDDGRGKTVLRYDDLTIWSTNKAPRLLALNLSLSNGNFAVPGTPVNVSITLTDAERDSIDIVWNFGDGSPTVLITLSNFTSTGNVSYSISHVYNSTGSYTMTISYTDNKVGLTYHNTTLTMDVQVSYPRTVTMTEWNWWDYTSLGLIFLGVGLVVARWLYLGRFRKILDMNGMTLDEYQIIRKEMRDGLNKQIFIIRSNVEAGKMTPDAASDAVKKLRREHSDKVNRLRSNPEQMVR